jgi:hypothetical protein
LVESKLPKIISRQEARNASQTHYFTGKPCCRGHIAPRYVVSCNCFNCIKEDSKPKYYRNLALSRKLSREHQRKWRAKHPGRAAQVNRNWYWRNHKKALEMARKWAREHPDQVRRTMAKWRLNNREHIREYRRTSEKAHQSRKAWRIKNAAKVKEIDRRSYWKHHDKRLAESRAYYHNNIESKREYARRWQREHKEQQKAYQQAYDAIYVSRRLLATAICRSLNIDLGKEKYETRRSIAVAICKQLGINLTERRNENG